MNRLNDIEVEEEILCCCTVCLPGSSFGSSFVAEAVGCITVQYFLVHVFGLAGTRKDSQNELSLLKMLLLTFLKMF